MASMGKAWGLCQLATWGLGLVSLSACQSSGRGGVSPPPELDEEGTRDLYRALEAANDEREQTQTDYIAGLLQKRPDQLPRVPAGDAPPVVSTPSAEAPPAASAASAEGPPVHSSQSAHIWLKGLAQFHAPLHYMHTGRSVSAYAEPYLLSDIKDYLARVGVKYVNPQNKAETVCIEPGQIKPDFSNLFNFECAGKYFAARAENTGLELFIPKKDYQAIARGGNGKCYASSKFIDPTRSERDNIVNPATHLSGFAEVTYAFWYPYNGNPVASNFVSRSLFSRLKAGHHEGDLEHLTVRVKFDPAKLSFDKDYDPAQAELVGVHYAAHGSEESASYTQAGTPPDNLDRNDGYKMIDGRLVAFVATQTHASYNRLPEAVRFANGVPKATTMHKWLGWLRLIPSDKTEKGILTDCRKVLEILPTAEADWVGPYAWLNYPGRMGADPGGDSSENGPENLSYKSWFYFEEGL